MPLIKYNLLPIKHYALTDCVILLSKLCRRKGRLLLRVLFINFCTHSLLWFQHLPAPKKTVATEIALVAIFCFFLCSGNVVVTSCNKRIDDFES